MTQDTRKDRRVKIVSLNVRYKSATVDEFIDNHALDVSRGGIYIKTNNPFSPGTLLKFEIRLVSDQAVITGVGRVVWKREAVHGSQDRPSGMGVKFIKVDDPSRALIDKLVNTRPDAGKAFESEPEAKVSSASQKRIPTPAAAHAATASSPSIRKGTIVGLGTAAAAGSSSPPAGDVSPASSALSAPSPTPSPVPKSTPTPPLGTPSHRPHAASPLPRPTSTPPLGTPSHRADVAGAAVRPEPDLPGATVRPEADWAGATMRPGAASSPPERELPASATPPSSSRSPLPRGPSMPPHSESAGDMFPKGRSPASSPPKAEATVMKQAAELLEEALREAGGSMDDVGNNPLFSSSARPPGPQQAPTAAAGDAAESGDSSAARSDPLPSTDDTDATNARALVAAMAKGPAPRRSETAASFRDSISGYGSNRGVGTRSPARSESLRPAVAGDDTDDASPERKKGGAAKWIVLGAAALAATAFAFRDEIAGTLGRTNPAPTASAGSSPSAIAPAAPAAVPSEPPVSAAASALVAPEAGAAVQTSSAPDSSVPPPRVPPSFGPRTVTAAPAPAAYVAPRPRPAAAAPATAAAQGAVAPTTAAPQPAARSGSGATSSEPGAASASRSSSPSAPAALPTTSAPEGSASPKTRPWHSSDDNPY